MKRYTSPEQQVYTTSQIRLLHHKPTSFHSGTKVTCSWFETTWVTPRGRQEMSAPSAYQSPGKLQQMGQ